MTEKKALVVDPGPEYFARLFRSAGYDVTFTSDCDSGLTALQSDEFDLYLFELDLPPAVGAELVAGLGRDLLQAVSERYGAETLSSNARGPYVWMTAVSGDEPDYADELRELGAAQILVAPIETATVTRALSRLTY